MQSRLMTLEEERNSVKTFFSLEKASRSFMAKACAVDDAILPLVVTMV
jgi:hypothetical protein